MKPCTAKYRRILMAWLLAALAGPGLAEVPIASIQDIDVQGLGHTPDWQIVISHSDDSILFTLEGTEYRYQYPATGPSIYRGYHRTTIYRVPNDEHSLSIIVKGRECQDSETGKAYEVSIRVVMDGVGYTGCGDVLNR